MRIAYLMAVHRDPKVLQRAISTLRQQESTFFVHVDQKSDLSAFAHLRGDDVCFTQQRIAVYWGEFSQVQATMLLMRQALTHPSTPDYLLFLQGSTYPLRSAGYIHSFLERNRGSEFMSMVKMPAPGKPLSRVDTLRFPSDRPVLRFFSKSLAKVGLARRDHRNYLGRLQPYSGGASWALSRTACEFMLEFLSQHPRVEGYFRNTFAPDEMFFHTVLGNSSFGSHVRRDLLYDDWSRSGPHPSVIAVNHVERFASKDKVWLEDMYGSGEVLFARKFSDSELGLLDLMDEMIRQKDGSHHTR